MKTSAKSPAYIAQGSSAEFIRRGLAAIESTEAAGDGVPAEPVIAMLEAKLAAARCTRELRERNSR